MKRCLVIVSPIKHICHFIWTSHNCSLAWLGKQIQDIELVKETDVFDVTSENVIVDILNSNSCWSEYRGGYRELELWHIIHLFKCYFLYLKCNYLLLI